MCFCHPFGRLGILAVVHQEDRKARRVYQFFRGFRPGLFQDIFCFVVDRHGNGCLCLIAEHIQQSCPGHGGTYRITVRASVADDIYRPFRAHAGNAVPVKLLQGFPCFGSFAFSRGAAGIVPDKRAQAYRQQHSQHLFSVHIHSSSCSTLRIRSMIVISAGSQATLSSSSADSHRAASCSFSTGAPARIRHQ